MKTSELVRQLQAVMDEEGDLDVMLSPSEGGDGRARLFDVEVSGTDAWGEPRHPDDADPDQPKVVMLWL